MTLMTGVGPAAALAVVCEWMCAPPRTAVLEPARCCRALCNGTESELLLRSDGFDSTSISISSTRTRNSFSSVGVLGGVGEGNAAIIMSGCSIGAGSGTADVDTAAATTFSAHVRHM